MDLVWPAAAWALWTAVLAAAFKLSGRERPTRTPEYDAPPPVVELLRGMRAQEVFHSALFELAGRGWVTIEGDRLSPAPSAGARDERARDEPTRSEAGATMNRHRPEPLLPYERWVLERVTARLAGAPYAPVIALMPDGADLESEFVPLVRQCAIDLGLARRRWPTMIVPLLLAAALVVPWYATVSRAGASWPGIIATAVSFVAGVSLLMGGRGFLPTARGLEVAGPEAEPLNPRYEWIFTGSGWQGVEIEPAGSSVRGPKRQEVAGHVVKRWVEIESSGEGRYQKYYIALHDGSSEKATAFLVDQGLYKDVLPGDPVRLLVKPRSGKVVRVLAHERHW
ncbi:DUF2207 domain-containing protein [Nonomuraea basaltis]|uniref:DUF2207 domain-containing protein n=1 Tax=Nonomuraea basaltis TaxID=2495887 RepID=UPI00110C4AA8|nr:DUF2207 domain-containing protein [Nonomuraea basaltis]TMR93409.1 DUF2207 domain-containing protein [Nonomuraea basaltis]